MALAHARFPVIDLDTFVISDTHFGHEKIIQFCGRPENHEELMLTRWNAAVAREDSVLHLGDLTYRGDRGNNLDTLSALKGTKYWIKGNHDKQHPTYYTHAGFLHVGERLGTVIESGHTRDGAYYENTIDPYGLYQDIDGMRVLFSHHPDCWHLDWDVNVHGHIHNNPPSSQHQEFIDAGHKYINVSVEMIDYTPVKLGDLLG